MEQKKIDYLRPALIIKNLFQNNKLNQSQIRKIDLKVSFSQSYQRKSFYSKVKPEIPSLKQAKQRQKQIQYFRRRNFYRRQKNLQAIFKENCRIYLQLQKQQSHYHIPSNRSKNSHSYSCTDYKNTKQNKTDMTSKEEGFENRTFLFERKHFSSTTKNKEKSQKKKNNMLQAKINFFRKNYQKSRTQMSRKNQMCQKKMTKPAKDQSAGHFNQFFQDEIADQQNKQSQKNASVIIMKKRPSTGLRH